MPAGYLRSFAKVATIEEALQVSGELLAAIGSAATVKSLLIEPYYKEDGWIEITPTFMECDSNAIMQRLADAWVESGGSHIWNPEAHWNQGEGVSFAVRGIVWALLETLD